MTSIRPDSVDVQPQASTAMRRARTQAFTLIEVLAAVFLTSVVLAVAIGFFIGLSSSTEAASNRTRDGRRALAVLDRVARDLQGAYLLAKPPELDPLFHPWVFIAANEFGGDGADRVKFVSRNYRPRNEFDHGSDVAIVTYLLRRADDGFGFELLRAVVPGLPDELDLEFPSSQDERFMVVARGVDHFAMRFQNEGGEWQEEWDSSQLLESALLPRAVELEIAYLPGDPSDELDLDAADGFFGGEVKGDDLEPFAYKRQVSLPMKAIDLNAMLEEAKLAAADGDGKQQKDDGEDDGGDGDEEEGDENGLGDGIGGRGSLDDRTVADCLSPDQIAAVTNRIGGAVLNLPLSDPGVQATLAEFGIHCP